VFAASLLARYVSWISSRTVRGEKSLALRELVQDTYQARSEAANTILTTKMKSKCLKFKILQRIIRKFPAIQWNRPNVILFHKTIPLRIAFLFYSVNKSSHLQAESVASIPLTSLLFAIPIFSKPRLWSWMSPLSNLQ
jgi:hypothetical protein